MNQQMTRPRGKAISRPPLLPAEIEGQAVELFQGERAIEVTLGWRPLLTLEEWQYHVLNGLIGRGGDTVEGLQELVRDRFGTEISPGDLAQFFQRLKAHELIAPGAEARHAVVGDAVADRIDAPEKARAQAVAPVQDEKQPGFALLRPGKLLWGLRGFFWIGAWSLFFLPPLLVVALFETVSNWPEITATFESYRNDTDLLRFVVLGLVSVNLVVTLVQACVAYAQGATVAAIALKFLFGFLPRLGLHLEDTAKLSRRQAMLIHAAPLVTRIYIAAVAVLVAMNTQHYGGEVTATALIVAAIATLSFLLTACPLIRGSGYYLLVEFLDEPKLRAKAFKALWTFFSRSRYQKADPQILVAYALVSIAFTLLVAVLAFLVFGKRLVAAVGPDGLIVIALVVLGFAIRTWMQLRKTNETYWKNYRFERWRDRTLPSQEQKRTEAKTRITPWSVLKFMALAAIVIGLFQTYEYRPSGPVKMLPLSLNELSSDIEGVVEEVYFSGGEILPAGTAVARLSTEDLEAQVRIREAERRQAQTDLDFVQVTCARNQELFEAQTISDVQLQRALSECAAAQAAVDILDAEIERLAHRIERSTFRMPFDGQLGSLYLQERRGTFLSEGEPIASVRDTSAFKVRLQLREVDLALVTEGVPIEVRVYAYPDEVFSGRIVSVDPDVGTSDRGRLVEAVGSIDNPDGRLRTGMSGVAKIEGVEMPVWQIITQGFYRFLVIDLWAWLP